MRIIAVAAAVEIVAGIVFVVSPSLVARLILNADLDATGIVVARVGGFGLLSLGLACWPGSDSVSPRSAALRGLLAYNALAALLFIYVGLRRALVGPLLWPVAAVHAALAILLARIFILGRKNGR